MLTFSAAASHLLCFLKEEVSALQVHLDSILPHRLIEHAIVGRWQFAAGEEIRRDATEERQVVVEKLGQVDINNGAQHQNILILIRKFQLFK